MLLKIFIILGLSFGVFLLIKYISGIKKNKYLYKAASKNVRSFSLSVLLLFIFFTLSFGYVYGSLTANITYKDNLDNYYKETNLNSYYVNNHDLKAINANTAEIFGYNPPEQYWKFYLPNLPYDSSKTWNDFYNTMQEWNSNIYEPIYGENYGIQANEMVRYNAYVDEYLTAILWDNIWNGKLGSGGSIDEGYLGIYDFASNYQLFYREASQFSAYARENLNSQYTNYKNISFVRINDYDPFNNSYYSTWDEVTKSNNYWQKTTSKDGKQNYYVGQYEFTSFYNKMNSNDLLAINNHSPEKEDHRNDVIQVAVDETFFEENNLVLGQEYTFEIQTKYSQYDRYTFQPIATFTDAFSSSSNYYSGTILVNSLDFSRMIYGDTFTINDSSGQKSSNYGVYTYFLIQTSDYINGLNVNQLTSQKKYAEMKQTQLYKSIESYNSWIYHQIFGDQPPSAVDSNRLYKFNEIFVMNLETSNIFNGTSMNYFGNAINGVLNFYFTFIVNIAISLILFLVVMFILFSIIKKKLQEESKQMGILKSLGYKIDEISISFLTFPIILILIANVFAILLSILFYHLSITALNGIYLVSLQTISWSAFILVLILVMIFTIVASYFRIRKTLKKPELDLLSGKNQAKINPLFVKLSNLGNHFKSFKKSYAFKNLFKSFSKSMLIFITVFISLFLITMSLMFSAFVTVNTNENFAGFKGSYITNISEWGWEQNYKFESIGYDLVPYSSAQGETYSQKLNSEFLLGDYNFGIQQETVWVNSSFNEVYDDVTLAMYNYMISTPIIKIKEDIDLDLSLITNTKNLFDLFDFSYISPTTSWNFLSTYFLMALKYENENSTDAFNEPGFNVGNSHSQNITFEKIYDLLFSMQFQKWFLNNEEEIYKNLPESLTINQISGFINFLQSLFISTFPTITFGKMIYDDANTGIFGFETYQMSKDESFTNWSWSNLTTANKTSDIDKFFNLKSKSGTPYSSLSNEQPNSDYVPVIIDSGISIKNDLNVGDYFYIRFDSDTTIKAKVVSIQQKTDYGIITSSEYIYEYLGKVPGFDTIFSNTNNYSYNEEPLIIPMSYYNNVIKKQLLNPNSNSGIYLINFGDSANKNKLENYRYDQALFYSIDRMKQISMQINKQITMAILLSSIVLLIIPMFLIVISIKETIDDNVIEVSMLKSFGYKTKETSALILSPYLLIIFCSFIILLPIAFLMFFGFTTLFIHLFAVDLTFKLLLWQWAFIFSIDFLIMMLLYLVSYLYYNKLKSKQILRNIF